MTRPTRIQTILSVAKLFAERSTCPRLHVGAVIARDGRIQATGYNGPPAGMDHCVHLDDSGCTRSVHAEANAIAFAARHGVMTNGCELYLTHSPCHTCAKLIVNAGIIKVIYSSEFRDLEGLDLLELANIETYCAGV
jgi:dCMP deaminase